MTKEHRTPKAGGGTRVGATPGPVPGKRTLTEGLQPTLLSDKGAPAQRKAGPEAPSSPSPPSGGGAPIAAPVRARMERAFGADFSGVRIHEGDDAPAIGALAYTRGTDIHFAPGQYRPEDATGQELLGHELAPGVQQSQGRVSATQQARGFPVNADATLEREANEMGSKAARGEQMTEAQPTSPMAPALGGQVVQKQEDESETRIPFLIRFDRPITRDEFIEIANLQIHGVHPGPGQWHHVAERYEPEDSPVQVTVAAGLVKRSRSESNADLGFGVEDDGSLEGADERAGELSMMPGGGEKAALLEEIDKRYWKTTGIAEGSKIKSKLEKGKVAIWNQIRDEVLAERAFISNLPDRTRHVLVSAPGGVEIEPSDYATVVRISRQIASMTDLDLEIYLRDVKKADRLEAVERSIAQFLATKQAAGKQIGDVIAKTDDGDWDVDDAAAKLNPAAMAYLDLDQRVKLISYIADGHLVGNDDEQTLIRLLTTTPTSDQAALVQRLKAGNSALLKKLESVIDGSENKEYYGALRNLVFHSMPPEEAATKMLGAKVFPWADPGIIKAVYNKRFYYEVVEYTEEGKLRVGYWINAGPMGLRTQDQLLEPDEIIGVHFFMDEDFASAKKGETLYMPAANLLAFKNEQFSRELSLVVDVGLLAAGGAGIVAKGGRLAKALAILDTTLAAADIAIDSFRSEIAASEEGKEFLRAWDTVNTLIAVYGLARVAMSLPGAFGKLRETYRSFKAGANGVDPADLKKIEQETEQLLSKADDVHFESEVTNLRKRYSTQELAGVEKQLEAAAGIQDAGKRQRALADIESQAAAQKANVELMESLRAQHPGKSEKELAELAKGDLRVPNVPFGYTADEFKEAQELIKQYMQGEGFKEVTGFATGSRITGATFNPGKKAQFGKRIDDFTKRDFDITLITDKKMTSGQLDKLKAAFKGRFKHDLGIRNVVDKRQLDHLPIYGKIDLDL